ncbi:glycosyl hydrolase family 18 protein [Peribacillus sp. SCS-155]|uniref:glycosyl hydrolase family 18 protein n=1 Tax=Peribacillus sedimenti TaxID=3115297 RepID=UPI0039066FD1
MNNPKINLLVISLILLMLVLVVLKFTPVEETALIQPNSETGQSSKKQKPKKFIMSYVYNDVMETDPNGYYSKSVQNTNGALDEISPPYFTLNEDGSLQVSHTLSKDFIREMHEKSIKVVPFISDNWNEEKARAALENREKLISQIAKAIEDYNLDGINVDIEHITERDRDDYTSFVKLLREKLPDKKRISVAVAANPNQWSTGWQGSYDNYELAKYSDYLMLMAYDEHSLDQGKSGPVASLPFVEKSVQSLMAQDVPPEKIVLGIPFYGRIWKDDGTINGLDVSLKIADHLADKYETDIAYNKKSHSPKASFTITKNDDLAKLEKWGQTLTPGDYILWYENEKSIKEKLALVQKYGLKGTGIWSLGQELPDTWKYYEKWLNKAYN